MTFDRGLELRSSELFTVVGNDLSWRPAVVDDSFEEPNCRRRRPLLERYCECLRRHVIDGGDEVFVALLGVNEGTDEVHFPEIECALFSVWVNRCGLCR